MWLILQYLHSNLHWSINELLSFMMLKMTLNYNFYLKYYQVKKIKQILAHGVLKNTPIIKIYVINHSTFLGYLGRGTTTLIHPSSHEQYP